MYSTTKPEFVFSDKDRLYVVAQGKAYIVHNPYLESFTCIQTNNLMPFEGLGSRCVSELSRGHYVRMECSWKVSDFDYREGFDMDRDILGRYSVNELLACISDKIKER